MFKHSCKSLSEISERENQHFKDKWKINQLTKVRGQNQVLIDKQMVRRHLALLFNTITMVILYYSNVYKVVHRGSTDAEAVRKVI